MLVKEGDTLTTGTHTFRFVMAPMVHWPEVMVTYEESEKVLFSADAFGTFGALNGNIFSDELEFDKEWLADARRYYANIVGKYGMQTQALLTKAAGLDIQLICLCTVRSGERICLILSKSMINGVNMSRKIKRL